MHIRIWNSKRANLDDEHTGLQREQHQEDKNGLSLFGVGEWVGGVVVLVG